MDLGKADFSDKIERFRMFFFGFAGETCDDIRRDARIIEILAEIGDIARKFFRCIFSVHPL